MCIERILQPLQSAGKTGVQMASGDGVVHHCHPIFAAHIGDYPEQILVTGVKTGECLCCNIPAMKLGNHNYASSFQDLKVVLRALETIGDLARNQACQAARIKPISSRPYWQNLPWADLFLSITPDILHQLYQGVIKHLVTWVKTVYSVDKIDACCCRLSCNHHVRVFTKGITSLYQLTGHEHTDIAQILLSLIIDMPLPNGMSSVRLVCAVCTILDFLHLT